MTAMDSDVGTGFSGDREIGRERSELNDEKVLRIIFSACFILVDFSRCHKPTPLKINLVLEIRLAPKQMGKLFL